MKKFITFLLLIIVSLQLIAQCPDSVRIVGSTFVFYYGSAPANVDSISITTFSGTTWVTVSSSTSTTLTTDITGSADSFTSLVYYLNGSITGTTCTTGDFLPITLLYFEYLIIDDNKVELAWGTISEHNFSHFTLEKFNGEGWDHVISIEGAGESSSLKHYQYIDENTYDVAYYRLQQVDFNGSYSYSDIYVIEYDRRKLVDIRRISLYGQRAGSNTNIVIIRKAYSDKTIIRQLIIH